MWSFNSFAGDYEAKSRWYIVEYKHETNGYVDTSTVCDNYKKGTLERKYCRLQAKQEFDLKCDKTKGKDKMKWCFAAALNPIR